MLCLRGSAPDTVVGLTAPPHPRWETLGHTLAEGPKEDVYSQRIWLMVFVLHANLSCKRTAIGMIASCISYIITSPIKRMALFSEYARAQSVNVCVRATGGRACV